MRNTWHDGFLVGAVTVMTALLLWNVVWGCMVKWVLDDPAALDVIRVNLLTIAPVLLAMVVVGWLRRKKTHV